MFQRPSNSRWVGITLIGVSQIQKRRSAVSGPRGRVKIDRLSVLRALVEQNVPDVQAIERVCRYEVQNSPWRFVWLV